MAWPVERAAKRNRASENRGGGGENGGAVSFQSILKRYRGWPSMNVAMIIPREFADSVGKS